MPLIAALFISVAVAGEDPKVVNPNWVSAPVATAAD